MKNIVKIIVDGDGGVGKTTMLKKLENGVFDPTTKLTIGLDFFINDYYRMDGTKIISQFWDIVGAERFNFLRPFCYRGANCIVLVYDLTRPNTLENMYNFINMAREVNIKPEEIILVGTKADLFYEKRVDSDYLAYFAEKHNFADAIEVSARNNHNLEVLFEMATAIAAFNKGIMDKEEFEETRTLLKERIMEPCFKPHEKFVRKCFQCKKDIYYYEYCDTNSSKESEERLLELWESPYIQFYCCACFKEISESQLQFETLK